MDLTHLSYSSISTYQLCPRSWKYRYIEKIQTPKSPNLVFGSAFHETLETLIIAKAKGSELEPVVVWSEKWNKHSAGDIQWNGDTPESVGNTAVRLLTNASVLDVLSKCLPLLENGEPVIEKRIELHVPGVRVPIIGFIDMVGADGVPCDFKTAARSWTQDQADKELQVLFYLAALNQAGYSLNPEMKFRHYVFTKTKNPQAQVIESSRKVSDMFWLFQIVTEVWRGIESETFPPNTSTWKCSPKWCEYYQMCRG